VFFCYKMEDQQPTLERIEGLVHHYDILNELMLQLFKDIGSRAPQSLPQDANANWLFEFTVSMVQDMIKHEFNQLMQLMYRVDVSEKKYSMAMQNSTSEKQMAEDLALLILDRELLKILTRKALR
jgi:hypothetical protein